MKDLYCLRLAILGAAAVAFFLPSCSTRGLEYKGLPTVAQMRAYEEQRLQVQTTTTAPVPAAATTAATPPAGAPPGATAVVQPVAVQASVQAPLAAPQAAAAAATGAPGR